MLIDVLPLRIEQVLPALRRLVGRHEVGVVGDAGDDDYAPGPQALRVALVLRLVGSEFRRDVRHVAFALLEIEHEAHVGDLHHVGEVLLCLAFGVHLRIQRAGLQTDVVGGDLREHLVELAEILRHVGFGVGAVEDELALLLRRLDVGAGLEAVHLVRLVARCGPGRGCECKGSGHRKQPLHWGPPVLSGPAR